MPTAKDLIDKLRNQKFRIDPNSETAKKHPAWLEDIFYISEIDLDSDNLDVGLAESPGEEAVLWWYPSSDLILVE